MLGREFESLPNEVIFRIIFFISKATSRPSSRNSIQDIRLVSRKLSIIASQFLITATRVRLSSESVSRFEQLCNKPEFNKYIKQVEINVAYYDIGLARDRDIYSEHCEPRLARIFRLVNLSIPPPGSGQEDSVRREYNVFEASASQPRQSNNEESLEESSRALEEVLTTLHDEYKLRAADQEHLRENNRHIDRLCHAMANLRALESIILTDKVTGPTDPEMIPLHRLKNIRDLRAFAFLLMPSGWNGSPITAYNTKPPVEMLGELLSQLGRSNVRPSTLALDLGMPFNMASLQLSAKQIDGICKLVSKATNLDVVFHSWSWKRHLSIDTARSYNAIQSLGSLTMALTSASGLKSLRISFQDYVWWQKLPGISINTLLPLKPKRWPDIRRLDLSYLPCGLEDLSKLIASCHGNIKSFSARALFLSGGDWDDALDILRGINHLDDFRLNSPRGGRYASGIGCHAHQEESIRDYVLKKVSENPLRSKPE